MAADPERYLQLLVDLVTGIRIRRNLGIRISWKELLIPFGLHHVFYLPFWQTGVGGTMEVGRKADRRCAEHLLCTAC